MAKPEASLTRPVFAGVAFADAFNRASAIVEQSPDSFAAKTLDSASPDTFAYFDDTATARGYPPRKEADLAPTVLAAGPAVTAPKPPSLLVAVPAVPVQLIALSFSPNEASAPVTSIIYGLAERVRQRAQKPQPLLDSVMVSSSATEKAAPAVPPRTFKLDFGDVDRPDLYSDLLVPSDPTHEPNRSVSVFMVVPDQRAAALGLHRGKPIASSTTSTSVAAS